MICFPLIDECVLWITRKLLEVSWQISRCGQSDSNDCQPWRPTFPLSQLISSTPPCGNLIVPIVEMEKGDFREKRANK